MLNSTPNTWNYNSSFTVKLKNNNIGFGGGQFYWYGLYVGNDTMVFYNQLFSIYNLLSNHFNRRININFNISLQNSYTKNSVSARMGNGNGPSRGFTSVLNKGVCLMEVYSKSSLELELILSECTNSFPVITYIKRYNF